MPPETRYTPSKILAKGRAFSLVKAQNAATRFIFLKNPPEKFDIGFLCAIFEGSYGRLRRFTVDQEIRRFFTLFKCQGGSPMSRAFYLGGLSAALLLCLGSFAEAGLFGHHHGQAACCEPTCGV